MKKKLLLLGLIFAFLLHLAGCVARVGAADLMDGIRSGEVRGKEIDEAFRTQEYSLALELFRSALDHSEEGNILISPVSVQLALAMTANGAAGQTRQEMEALLGGDLSLELLNEYLYTYRTSLSHEENAKLQMANSIWYRDDEDRLQVEEAFLQKNRDYYDAQIYKAPFDTGTLKDINTWVKDRTDGMIDGILEQIDPDTVMYLLNALAFDAKWLEPYRSCDVWQGTFHSYHGEEQQVDMMHSTEYHYFRDDSATGFHKDYRGKTYSFAAILPEEGTDIYDYVAALTPESLMALLGGSRGTTVQVTMPKFTFDYELSMNEALRSLGMETAFDSVLADFSSMARSSRGNLCIGDVLHKTHISVDEEGTKAAAVTKVEIVEECAVMVDRSVTLDRPFLFLILDRNTNIPIFMGMVTDLP